MTPIRIADPEAGPWGVKAKDGKLLTWGLESNADAWRWIDKHSDQALEDEDRRRRIQSAFADR